MNSKTKSKQFAWLKNELWEVTGPNPQDFLNHYNTQDIMKLGEEQITYGAFLNQKGKIISDSWIIRTPEKLFLLLTEGYGEKLSKHLEIFMSLSEIELKPVLSFEKHLAFWGGNLENSTIPKIEENQSRWISEKELLCFKSNRLGILATEFFTQEIQLKNLEEKLKEQGFEEASKHDLEILRILAGFPKLGQDMDESNLVAEVGLDHRATNFNKGCYLGQETTARVHNIGKANKKLSQLKFHQLPKSNLPIDIYHEDKIVGKVSSVVDALSQGVIGLGTLEAKFSDGENSVHISEDAEGKLSIDQ